MTLKTVLFTIIAPSILLGLIGCGAKSQDLLNRNISSAFNLREHCVTGEISSEEISIADSLLKSAISAVEGEKFEDAEWQSELASTYYKIGILKNNLSQSENDVKKLQSELKSDKEKLNGLIDVYEEIKSLRKQ